MKTNIRAFQRDFPRMRRLAAAGTVIVVNEPNGVWRWGLRHDRWCRPACGLTHPSVTLDCHA